MEFDRCNLLNLCFFCNRYLYVQTVEEQDEKEISPEENVFIHCNR
jgi:hypothetical protein